MVLAKVMASDDLYEENYVRICNIILKAIKKWDNGAKTQDETDECYMTLAEMIPFFSHEASKFPDLFNGGEDVYERIRDTGMFLDPDMEVGADSDSDTDAEIGIFEFECV